MINTIEVLWRRLRSLDVVGIRTLQSRVCEIVYFTINTKGYVKKKMKKPIGS